jgi:hypothetical protein
MSQIPFEPHPLVANPMDDLSSAAQAASQQAGATLGAAASRTTWRRWRRT